MSGYVKIYGSILGSSVWAEAPTTRIVWITMLAMADQFGHVEASVSGLARFANVSAAECRKALDALSAPDPDSKSPEFEGRRVEKWERGWTILNYLKYREMRTPKQVADADRQREYRNRDTSQESQPVAPSASVPASEAGTANYKPPRRKKLNVTTLEAGEIINRIQRLAVRVPNGASIPRKDVEAMGADVLRAYDAIGGAKRFTKDDDYVLLHFSRALSEAREA